MPTRPPRRRLSLLDLMILVGSCAVGLGACRFAVAALLQGNTSLGNLIARPEVWTFREVVVRVIDGVVLVLVVFGPWTFALPALWLRSPRPSWRRLMTRPGFTACLAAVLGMVAGGLVTTLTALVRQPMVVVTWLSPFAWLRIFLLDVIIVDAGRAVLIAWTFQALAGRWRPEPGPLDRLGLALGWLWIVAGVVWGVRRYALLP